MIDVLVDVLVFSLWGYSWLRAVPIRTLIVSTHWGRKGVFGDYDDDRVDDPDPRLAKLMPPPLLGVVLVLGCEFPYFFYNFWGLFLLFDTIGVSCEARGTWLLPYALSVGEHFTGSLWETWQFFGWAQDFDLGYVPGKKIKICGWDLPKNPMLSDIIWPITQWPGFCLGWIRWKSACPKPSSTLTASLLVLIFHMQPWCSLRLRFAAGILII